MELNRSPNEELVFSNDYVDVYADLVAPGAMKIGNEEYFRLTFVRHKLTPSNLPSVEGAEIPVIFEKQAVCSVTLPKSVAKDLSRVINSMMSE